MNEKQFEELMQMLRDMNQTLQNINDILYNRL